MRTQVAALLAPLGADASPAIPALLRMSDNRHPYVRRAADAALPLIDPTGDRCGQALVAAVLNKDPTARALLIASAKRASSRTALLHRLSEIADQDPDEAVRAEARAALTDLGQRPAP